MSKMITFDEEQRVFHLHNDKISYLFQVEKGDLLSHLYYGQRFTPTTASAIPDADRASRESPRIP